jgi:hypothetical protein
LGARRGRDRRGRRRQRLGTPGLLVGLTAAWAGEDEEAHGWASRWSQWWWQRAWRLSAWLCPVMLLVQLVVNCSDCRSTVVHCVGGELGCAAQGRCVWWQRGVDWKIREAIAAAEDGGNCSGRTHRRRRGLGGQRSSRLSLWLDCSSDDATVVVEVDRARARLWVRMAGAPWM